MESKVRKEIFDSVMLFMNYKRITKQLLLVCAIAILFCTYDTMVCASEDVSYSGKINRRKNDKYSFENISEADGGGEEQEAVRAEVVEFVKSFYEALSEENYDKAREMLEEDSRMNEIGHKILFARGFQRYDNVTVIAYPITGNDVWLAVAAYDMFVEDMDVGFPGLITYMVRRQEDGQWIITEDFSEEWNEGATYEQIEKILAEEEFLNLSYEVNSRYAEIMRDNPEYLEWLYEVRDAITEAVSLDLLEDDGTGNAYPEENIAEETDSNIYIVQKGDCLWSIAQSELGEGMRWGELYKANQNIIGDNPNLILEGMLLQLPTDDIDRKTP